MTRTTTDRTAALAANEAVRARKWADLAHQCSHPRVSSTTERGWHCTDCGAALLSLAIPIPLQAVADALQAKTKAENDRYSKGERNE